MCPDSSHKTQRSASYTPSALPPHMMSLILRSEPPPSRPPPSSPRRSSIRPRHAQVRRPRRTRLAETTSVSAPAAAQPQRCFFTSVFRKPVCVAHRRRRLYAARHSVAVQRRRSTTRWTRLPPNCVGNATPGKRRRRKRGGVL